MSQTEVQQEFKNFVEAIDAIRKQIATMKSDTVAQELYQVLFADNEKYIHLLRCFQLRATYTVGSA